MKYLPLVLLLASCVQSPAGSTSINPGESVTVKCVPNASPVPIPTVTVTATVRPDPEPSPSATPAPSPSPNPGGTVLRALAAEPVRLSFTATADEVLPVVPGLKIEAFNRATVTTLVGSAREFPPGVYEDEAFPVARLTNGLPYLVEVTGLETSQASSFQLQGKAYTLRTFPKRLQREPSLPIYAELEGFKTVRAHGLTEEVSIQGPLTKKYAELLRAHRIEPIKQDITTEPAIANGLIDLNRWSTSGASFKQLVLDDRIACPMVIRYVPCVWIESEQRCDRALGRPSDALLKALQASITAGVLPACSWAYLWDEGQADSTIVQEVKTRAVLYQTHAPGLARWITWRKSAEAPLFALLIPVANLFTTPADYAGIPYGGYVSCMSNGNCGNHASHSLVAPRTPYPVATLDGPNVELRAWVNALESQGARVGLYFNTTQRLATARTPGGQYNEGGNGDGTMLYPGRKGYRGLADDIPIGSLRLKAIQDGSIDVEYRRLARAAGVTVASPAQTYTSYSRDPAQYEAMRESVRRALFPAYY